MDCVPGWAKARFDRFNGSMIAGFVIHSCLSVNECLAILRP